MRRTLLELTQDILSEIDGDQVNSISDTIESLQVVNLIKQAYFDILDERHLLYVSELTSLTGLADVDRPNIMGIPEDFQKIEWIKYDNRIDNSGSTDYKDVEWMPPYDFVTYVHNRNSIDSTNFLVIELSPGVPLIIDTKVAPRWWTTFDDQFVVFDSYDSDVESTTQSSRCLVQASRSRTFTAEDTFIPDLPDGLFQYLYHKAKSVAFATIARSLNQKSEQSESRARTRSQRNDYVTGNRTVQGVDYGKPYIPIRSFKRRTP